MVTKRTRLLSFFATILMLVSMLACIVIPASAESAELLALKAKYEALDPENFDGLEGDPIGAAIAQMEQYIAAFEENVDMQQEIIEAAAAYDAQLTETLNGKVKEGAEVRYALKGIYESYGYPMDATSYLISEVEDWKAAADSGNTFSGITLKVTNDIDFTEAGNVDPLTMDEEVFKGVLDGQGHKFIGMTVNVAGPSYWTGALVSSLAGGAVVKNLTLDGGSLTVNVKDQGSDGNTWPGAGSVVGYAQRNSAIYNVGSSMDVTVNALRDGKAGFGGLVGWGDSSYYIDNCYYTGTATNNSGPASDFGYAGGGGGMKLYNSIGAGDLHATVTPVGLYRCAEGYFSASLTGEQAGTTNQLAFNSYAVGHDTVSIRDQKVVPDALNATYFGETYTRANINKAHAAADIKEAAWKVNSNFDNTKQSAQVYFMDVQDGELCFTTDAAATLKRVLVEVGTETMIGYFHPGDTVNLVNDLGLGTGIDTVDGVEVNASFEFTMPGEDLELVVTYNDDEALAAARETLAKELEFFEGLDVEKAFVDAQGVQEWLDMTADEELTSDPDAIAFIIEMKADLDLSFKSDYPVAYSKKGYYAESIPAGHSTFGIYEKGDWLKLVEDYRGVPCSLTLYVMDEIDFEETPMLPLSYTANGGLSGGKIYGQGHTFKNINIVGTDTTNWRTGIALVAAAHNDVVIDGLGLTGKVTNTATSATWGADNRNHYTAAFIAGKHNNDASNIVISNCWADVHVKGPSNDNGGVAVFLAYPSPQHSIVNCINYGTVESTTNGKVGVFMNGHAINPGLMKNNIDNGTIITSGVKAAFLAHGNMDLTTSTNNWSVNDTYNFRDGKANTAVLLPDGTTAAAGSLNNEAVSECFKINSAKEAAYKATAGANGEVFYTVEDGKVAFAEAKSVYKVAINGDDDLAGYYLPGETVDLIADLGLQEGIESLTGYDYTADYKLTMPAEDITLTVTYLGDVALINAKEELNALIADYEKYNLNLLENSTIGTWLEAAKALAGSEDATLDALKAQIEAADAIAFGTLKADAKVPYSKKALYADLMAEGNTVFGIYEKADWIQLTNDYATTSCALRIYVMNDIEFDPNENVKPLSYVAHGLTGLLDGQGYTFKNIKIEKDGSGQANHYGVGLVGALSAGGTIQNLGLTGTVTNTSTNAATKTAAFCGGKNNGGGGNIKNCWADVHVKGPSAAENGTLAVFFAYPQTDMVVENCINYGTVESTSVNGGAAVFSPYNAVTAKNCLDLGTIIAKGSGNAGAFNNHTNSVSYFVNNNNWSVNTLWASSRAFDANSVGAQTLPNGGSITSADDINNYFAVSSAKEAAYKATAGANGAVYYTVNEDGKVVYGSATDRLYKIAITGDDNLVGYYLAGETVDLIADLGLKEGIDSLTGYDYTADYKLTMPAEDLTLTVAYGDAAALVGAKEELNALIAEYAEYDLNLLENSTIGSWLEAANALVAGEDLAAIRAQIAAADAITFGTLKVDAKVPYSKKSLYADLMAEGNTVFGIYEKADWYALLGDYATTSCNLKLYVMDDIYFENEPMRPLSYVAHGLTGLLDGQGHTFYDININMEGAVANHYGVALVGALSAGGTIQNLTLTGNITNTSTNGAALTAAFAAGKNNGTNAAGVGSAIINCRSDVHVKGPSKTDAGDTGNGLAAFRPYIQANDQVINCINNGIVESTTSGGTAGTFSPYRGAKPTIKNCVDNGSFVTTGVKAAILTNGGWGDATAANNWAVGHDAWWFNKALDPAVTLPDGTTASTAAEVNAYYSVASAKEAAYKATAGANGEVFYTVEDGKIAFAEAKSVYKVAITGDDNLVGYYLPGETVDLIADLGLKEAIESLTGYDYTADYKLTMPAEDITLTVAYGDGAALETAKVELNALIADYEKYDLNLLENSTIGTWLEAAKALAGSEDATLDALNAQIEAADAIAIGTLKADAKVPYSKKALYADLMAADNTVFGIYEKTDWLKLVEDFSGKACSLTLYVMDNIDFEETPMLPLSYTASSGLNGGKIYGQGHTFENINIVGTDTTNWRTGIALVSAASGSVVIDSLGLTGKVTNTATSATWGADNRNHYTAAFIAGKHNDDASNIVISNCWADVHVKGPSDNNGGIAVFLAYPAPQHSIVNCINYGTVESTTNGKVGVFMNGHSINPGLMKNNIDNGTIITSGVKAAFLAHGNMDLTTSTNNWSVNDTYNFRDGKANTAVLLPDGTTAEANLTNAQVSEIYKIVSAEETAYVATANAGGDVIFTVKDGKVAYGTATDRVQKIAFVGDVEIDKYLKAGATFDLSEISTDDATVFTVTTEGYENAIADGILTVPNADITINVVGEVIDLGAYTTAKAALEALSAKYGALRADLFTNGAAIADAKAAIDAALAADAESTDDTKQAIIDLAATVEVDLTLKDDAKVPYGTKALYAEYGASTTEYGIYEKADWIAATLESNNFAGISFYVMNDIEFGSTNMAPLSYAPNVFRGNIYGQGHTFKNIKIEMTGGTGQYNGVSLVSALAGGTIDGLGVTGVITNLSTSHGSASTAVFSGGANAGAQGTISNCWSSVTVSGPSNGQGQYLAVFQGTSNTNLIKNCINYGQVISTNGSISGVFYTYGAQSVTTNSLDLGTGATASIVSHGNGSSNVNNNNWSVNEDTWYFTTGAPESSVTLPNGTVADTTEKVNAYYRVGSAAEAAWRATNGANGAVFYKLDAEKGVTYGTATNRVQKVEFTEDVLAAFYLNNGATITLSEICDVAGATFTVTTEGYENAIVDGILTVPNADITVEVITPGCKHTGEFRFEHIEGGETHNKICVACGETVEVLPCVTGEVTENAPVVDGENITFTHSSFCNDCEFEYKEDCEKTLVPNTFDCTEDSKYTFTCGREDYILVGSGNEDHTWGDWTTEGATEGYKRHDCENCDQFEEELLPLAAPVIIIEAKEDKAGATGVEFIVKLTEAGVKAGTITITLPEWAENVSIVAEENVTVDGLVATITGNIAAGSVLLTGTYDIDHLAGENGVITATATNVLNEREEAVEVAVATADATIDVILGDAHVDGVINIIDALAVLRNSVGKDDDVNRANADVNADGDVNINDAIWIVRWWLGDENGPALGV